MTFEAGVFIRVDALRDSAELLVGYHPTPPTTTLSRGMLCSQWTGFLLMHRVINRAIKPYWFRRREVSVRSIETRACALSFHLGSPVRC